MEQYRVTIDGVCTCVLHVCVCVCACVCACMRALCVCVCVCATVCVCEVGLQICIREFLVARRILDICVSVVCCLRTSSYRLHQPGVFPCTTGVEEKEKKSSNLQGEES
jgi:hypothetical protein